jgi:hypothetical protein
MLYCVHNVNNVPLLLERRCDVDQGARASSTGGLTGGDRA